MSHAAASAPAAGYSMGLDLSTTSLTAVLLDIDSGRVSYKEKVVFDEDCPLYHTRGGVLRGEGGVVRAPVAMWIEALDILFNRLYKRCEKALADVRCLSCSAQQHGCVFWDEDCDEALGMLDADLSLVCQLQCYLKLEEVPVWMDSSTSKQCVALTEAMGGAEELAKLTGSPAHERFTAAQLAAMYAAKGDDWWASVPRVSLISSFVTSLLCGSIAPIDHSDGSGMNLLDLRTREWSERACDATAPGLQAKLGRPVASASVVGRSCDYFCNAFGLAEEAVVVAGSGDNPCSVAALPLGAGDIAISLGTSDTVLAAVDEASPGVDGHVLLSPTHPDAVIAMLCFKNGSLARRWACDRVADGDWETFSKLLRDCAVGSRGHFAAFWPAAECTPRLSRAGCFLTTHDGDEWTQLDASKLEEEDVEVEAGGVEARACVEGQAMAMRLHSEALGIARPRRLLATGGASTNEAVLQVLADVFGADVWTIELTDGAALGAGLRAIHGMKQHAAGHELDYDVSVPLPTAELAVRFDEDAHARYNELLPLYERRRQQLVDKLNCA